MDAESIDWGFAVLLGQVACVRDRAERNEDAGLLRLASGMHETVVQLMQETGVVSRHDREPVDAGS